MGRDRLRVSIVGASGKIGQYMVQHALDRGHEVVGVCRERSVGKLDRGGGVPAGVRQQHTVDRRAGSDLEEGESQGLPVWSRHVGDPILEDNITRRIDFALFMVDAVENDELVHQAPAIVGCRTPSALTHAASE